MSPNIDMLEPDIEAKLDRVINIVFGSEKLAQMLLDYFGRQS